MSTNASVRYNRQLFQNKINELEGYLQRLKSHIDVLEGYRDQIKAYWKDDLGREYIQLIDSEIIKVKDSQKQIEDRITVFNNTVGEIDSVKEINQGALEDAKSVVNAINVFGS